jgi:hypothetical protein
MSATISATVSVKAMKARATLMAKAIKQLSSLPTTAHPALATRAVLDTSGMFTTMTLTIHKFRYLVEGMSCVDVQRDHLRRIERHEVAYLHALHLTHTGFVCVMNPKTGLLELADGNTRAALNFLADGTTELPSHVSILVYVPDNAQMYKDVYHCIDSQVNAKRTRHNITSFYKNAGLDATTLSSALVRDANLVSAFRRVARFKGMGSITGQNDKNTLETLVHSVIPELRYLDLFGYSARKLQSQGFYAMILILKSQLRSRRHDELTDFINEIALFAEGNQVKVSKPISEMFAELNRLFPQGWGGETQVDVVFGLSFLAFTDYLSFIGMKASKLERIRLKAVANALTELPEHYVCKIEGAKLKVA